MDAVVRAWLGFLALGAGLIHLALILGSPLGAGIPLAVIGVAEFGWGVFAFTAPRIPVPRIARLGVLVPIVAWIGLLVLGGPAGALGVRILPMLVASLLDVAVSVGITIVLRRSSGERKPLTAGRYLIAVGAGALIVAAITTPALAATEAGELAVPHGTFPDGSHGH